MVVSLLLLVLNTTNPPTRGPRITPRPLNDCARFSLLTASSGGPKTETYGLAAVSNMAKPHPIINNANKKKLKVLDITAG
ncbi:hypothetical protein D3C86_2047280 [compost metagenome]